MWGHRATVASVGIFRKAFGTRTNEPALLKRNHGQETSLDHVQWNLVAGFCHGRLDIGPTGPECLLCTNDRASICPMAEAQRKGETPL